MAENLTLKATLDMIRWASIGSEIKTRNKMDFLETRIARAALQPTLLKMMEKLMKVMQTPGSAIRQEPLTAFLKQINAPDASAVKRWLQEYNKTAAMVCFFKNDEYEEIVRTLHVEGGDEHEAGYVGEPCTFDIDIEVKCLSPLSHGSDIKMGNATIFRRMTAVTNTGALVDLPFYGGNAFRGQMRRLLANDFLQRLGFEIGCNSAQIRNFLGHMLYEGGSLVSGSDAEKYMKAEMGNAASIKTGFIRNFRNRIPFLSTFGCVVGGNKIIDGRINVNDLRPACNQWFGKGSDVNDLIEWTYGTNRDADEEKADGTTAMIYDIECLRVGTVLRGGIDFRPAVTPLDRACVVHGLDLMAKYGYIGATSRAGYGKVAINYPKYCDPSVYTDYIEDNKFVILDYLDRIGAIEKVGDDVCLQLDS